MSLGTDDLLRMFGEEAEERLDRMVDALLALERGASGTDAIAELFRDAHSIKGGASMMGLEPVYEIANELEDRLSEAREAGVLDPSDVGSYLESVDELRRAVAAAGPGAERAAPAAAAPPAAETAPPGPEPADGDRRSMRVEASKVDRLLDAVGETVLQQRRLEHALEGTAEADGLLGSGDVLLGELQDAVIQLRTMPLSAITGPFPRAVRDLAAAQDKEAELIIEGAETQLDRGMLEGASETIGHLLRNAVGHGVEDPETRRRAGKPERATIRLRAEPRGARVAIEVSDDGRGVSPDLVAAASGGRSLVDVLAEPGTSTATSVTELSGRGVGLDAVRSAVAAVGGDLQIDSSPGSGTRVTLLMPVSLVLLHVLLVESSGATLGVPIAAVEEVAMIDNALALRGRRSIDVRGQAVALVDPAAASGGNGAQGRRHAVVVAAGGRRAALACDDVTGEEEVLVKPLGPLLEAVPGYIGAAIMRDGRVALIADPAHLASLPAHAGAGSAPAPAPAAASPAAAPTVLVVDDQFTVRELQRSILEASGYRVRTARDGREAWELLGAGEDVDIVVTDIEMPEMSGLELLEAIRRAPGREALPVVVVTSRAQEEDERRGLEAGADAYLVKERFDQRVLLDTVGRLLAR